MSSLVVFTLLLFSIPGRLLLIMFWPVLKEILRAEKQHPVIDLINNGTPAIFIGGAAGIFNVPAILLVLSVCFLVFSLIFEIDAKRNGPTQQNIFAPNASIWITAAWITFGCYRLFF